MLEIYIKEVKKAQNVNYMEERTLTNRFSISIVRLSFFDSELQKTEGGGSGQYDLSRLISTVLR